jgi:hypothetical protein
MFLHLCRQLSAVEMGSAPAPGAVFRALLRRAKARQRDGGAENFKGTRKFQTFGTIPNALTAGREGASRNARGGRAPQLRFSG